MSILYRISFIEFNYSGTVFLFISIDLDLFGMFYISFAELDRKIRHLRSAAPQVSDYLRGWNWGNEYLTPPIDYVLLGVSEVANRYCPTYRDIYLRRISGVKAPYTFKTVRGWVYHGVSSETLTQVKEYLYRMGAVPGYIAFRDLLRIEGKIINKTLSSFNVREEVSDEEYESLYSNAKTLYKYLVLQASSQVDRIISRIRYLTTDTLVSKVVPSVVERTVDGSLLGLSSQLRVDMLLERNVVLDIKTGSVRSFHKYTLAGYALAIEADLERPIDYGIISYLRIDGDFVKVNNHFFFISDELRREFLNLRDEAMEVLHSGVDPGKPPSCPSYCIYHQVCNR